MGGEFTILPGQTWEQVAEATLGRVHEFALKHFPNALEVQTITSKTPIAEVQVDKAPNPVQAAIDDIKKCETMDDLKSFWTLSKSNLNISLAYKEKEKQLKDAEK